MWSIGCIICELFTGDLLFPTHEDTEHLGMIEKNSGKFPNWMIAKARERNAQKAFLDGSINEDRIEHIENIIGFKTMDDIFRHYPLLADLIKRCL